MSTLQESGKAAHLMQQKNTHQLTELSSTTIDLEKK